jgi:tripartite-type tricarboxylate transporter receptor subunit TctC
MPAGSALPNPRQTFRFWSCVATALLVFAAAGMSLPASAQAYPTRAVKLVVPFPPGGSLDLTGRLIAQRLTDCGGNRLL